MTCAADLGMTLATAASLAPRIRVEIADPNDGGTIAGVVIASLSATHVRLRADDGLIWPVALADLRTAPEDPR